MGTVLVLQYGCNMGTVLILHKRNKMKYKNRPYIAQETSLYCTREKTKPQLQTSACLLPMFKKLKKPKADVHGTDRMSQRTDGNDVDPCPGDRLKIFIPHIP